MSGFIGDMSPNQTQTLQRFRSAVRSLPNKPEDSDEYYLRWLRGTNIIINTISTRNFDYDSALEMFKKHLKWRQEVGADHIFDWKPPEVLHKYFPGGFFGEDRDGHPVYYDFYGNIDVKGLYRSCKADDIIKYKIYHGELTTKILRDISIKKGRHIETVSAVLNMENLSYQRQYHWPSIKVIRELFQIFAENYPERTKSVYIINAPRVFPLAYNIVKHFIEEDTRRKLVIMGDNWRTELQKYIAADQLPVVFGGTCCDPDPQCTNFLNWGGDIPVEYYMTNNTETDKDNMESVMIGRASSHQLEIEVDTENSFIRWEYLSIDYDISFGMFYKSTAAKKTHCSDEMSTIIPLTRKNSHVFPETGVHQCNCPGTYVFKFDNSYSWTRTKEVLYSIEVLPPDHNITNEDTPTFTTAASDDDDDDEFEDCIDELGVVSEISGRSNDMSLEENHDEDN